MVSVVIPTFNSESTIGLCLKSLEGQTYRNIEIIVVDKFSSDKTTEIAREHARVIPVKAHERSEQANRGVRASKGKYIYRVDSDFVLEPDVIEQCVTACENAGFDAMSVPNLSDPRVSFWSRVRALERGTYVDDYRNVWGGQAHFMMKNDFEAVGGYDERLIAGEDYDLHNMLVAANFKVGRVRAHETHMGEPKTLVEIVRKHYYYGTTLRAFTEKNGRRGLLQFSPVRVVLLKHWREFLRQPTLMLGFLVYQYVRYSAASIGFLVGALANEGLGKRRSPTSH